MPTHVFDSECYVNYYLAMFRDIDTGEVRSFEMHPAETYDDDGMLDTPRVAALDRDGLRRLLDAATLITFNGTHYDVPILTLALTGASCRELKAASDRIIKNNLRPWETGIEPLQVDHIDLIEVAPGMVSLKVYGGRMHCAKLQDLPYDPDAEIDAAMRAELRTYCANDLDLTEALYRTLRPQIALREAMSAEYGIDLRSKSDAQIAEAVIKQGVEATLQRRLERPQVEPGSAFTYTPPAGLARLPLELDALTTARFTIEPNGSVAMPPELASLAIRIGQGVYRMGIGGLHSSEKTIAHHADDERILVDRDVASYYPAIILNCGLRPRHMGLAFSKTYRSLVERRLAAKAAGDRTVADSLKITINGSFGKFGSQYSILYSPQLLIQTTITGQLALLMLIARLEAAGISVVSANTDGIVIRCRRAQAWELEAIVWQWEAETGFVTEETAYRSLYARDVNNYIAVKPDGSVKLKGAYAQASIAKSPAGEICVGAAVRQLVAGVPIEQTIRACADVRKFVYLRQVRGGASDRTGAWLGKTVRWYYARGVTGAIHYKVNGYRVPATEGAQPLMELPDELPADVDFERYIAEAQSILEEIGAVAPVTNQQELFA